MEFDAGFPGITESCRLCELKCVGGPSWRSIGIDTQTPCYVEQPISRCATFLRIREPNPPIRRPRLLPPHS